MNIWIILCGKKCLNCNFDNIFFFPSIPFWDEQNIGFLHVMFYLWGIFLKNCIRRLFLNVINKSFFELSVVFVKYSWNKMPTPIFVGFSKKNDYFVWIKYSRLYFISKYFCLTTFFLLIYLFLFKFIFLPLEFRIVF